jgi:hypothetical protein
MRELGLDIIIQCNSLAILECEFRVLLHLGHQGAGEVVMGGHAPTLHEVGHSHDARDLHGSIRAGLDPKSLLACAATLEYTTGKPAGGFVVATNVTDGPQESFKVINNRFRLKHGL